MARGRSTPPPGYVDMTGAVGITGYTRETIRKAFVRGEIPCAIQRKTHAPMYFTEAGLRKWLGIEDDAGAA